MKIFIVGLGPAGMDYLPLRNLKILKEAARLFYRTNKHPLLPELEKEGIRGKSLDHFYQEGNSFEEVYQKIVSFLLQEATGGDLAYAVPGNPAVGEKTVEVLKAAAPQQGVEIEILPAMSSLDLIWPTLGIDPLKEGVVVLDAQEEEFRKINPFLPQVFLELYSPFVAGDLKLNLMRFFPDEHQVVLLNALGVKGEEKIRKIALYELDRQKDIDYLTSLYVPPLTDKKPLYTSLDELAKIVAVLRSEKGCPWDRKQNLESIKRYLLEEAYEVVEAIEERDMAHLEEELGDLLFQIVFQAELAKEEGWFTMDDVLLGITAKMIRRHPHVFGREKVGEVSEVLQRWEEIKEEEKEETEDNIFDIPQYLPSLMRAQKIQEKAARAGFDWPSFEGPAAKIESELKEFLQAKTAQEKKEELGDLLFSVVNLARHFELDAEEALRRGCLKFENRIRSVLIKARAEGVLLTELSPAELDFFWEEVKKMEKK